MNNILEDLSKPFPACQHREVFNKFPRANIARQLNISSSYLSNCMNGFSTPSAKLEKKMTELVEQIKTAQAETAA